MIWKKILNHLHATYKRGKFISFTIVKQDRQFPASTQSSFQPSFPRVNSIKLARIPENGKNLINNVYRKIEALSNKGTPS